MAQSKKGGKIKGRITISSDDPEKNFQHPITSIGVKFYQEGDTKLVAHLIKVDPTKDWGKLNVNIESRELVSKYKASRSITIDSTGTGHDPYGSGLPYMGNYFNI